MSPRDAQRAGIGDHPPGVQPAARAHRRRERLPRPRAGPARAGRPPGDARRAPRELLASIGETTFGPRRPGRAARRRPAAGRRDRQGARPGRRGCSSWTSRPPRWPTTRSSCSTGWCADCRSGASALLYVSHRLRRGLRPVRPDHRAQGRPSGHHRGHRRHHQRRAGAADGRPRARPATSRPGRPGRPSAPVRLSRPRRGQPEAARRRPRAARRRDRSASAACRAPGGPRWPARSSASTRSPPATVDARRPAGPAALTPRRDAGRHRLRHRGPQGRGHRRRPVGARQRAARRPGRLRRPGRGRAARTVGCASCWPPSRSARAGDDQEIRFLSGGNQQKVVLGPWLARRPADPALRRADPRHRRRRQGRPSTT